MRWVAEMAHIFFTVSAKPFLHGDRGAFGEFGSFIAFTPFTRGMVGLAAGLFLILYPIRTAHAGVCDMTHFTVANDLALIASSEI